MSHIYISDNKKFVWKALVVPHLIEDEDKCPDCGGTGKRSRFDMMWNDECDDGKCQRCDGRGRRTWYGPLNLDNEVQSYLQKCLDKYIEDKIVWTKENPPFVGMGI